MKSIDLFSGAGGLTRGLHDAGWEPLAAVEYDPVANQTFRHNFPGVELIEGDAGAIDYSRWHGAVDLVAGGPPCQPFSVAGLQRAHEDPRDCVPHFVRAVAEIAPSAFLMENVLGLAMNRHRPYLLRVIGQLADLGYRVAWKVLDAADHGVPQHRNRVFVVGMRDRQFVFPKPTHGSNGAAPHNPSGPAIAAAPADVPNTAIVSYAKNPVLRPQPFDGMLVNGGGRPINLAEPCQTIPASAGGNRTHIYDPNGILSEYHAQLMEGAEPRSGLVDGVRRLTVSESAAIQSFPSDFQFVGKQSARYRQVGNAVPPVLARAVGQALLNQLQRPESTANDPYLLLQAPLLTERSA